MIRTQHWIPLSRLLTQAEIDHVRRITGVFDDVYSSVSLQFNDVQYRLLVYDWEEISEHRQTLLLLGLPLDS